MCAVLCPWKIDHTVDTRESCAATTILVWIELLLGQDITTVLWILKQLLDLIERL